MLYPKNQTSKLQDELFKTPTSEYRGTPFWAWNGKLDREELGRQIDIFEEMGLGGFHMHVRTGMDSPYLDEEFMEYIRFCVNKAKEKGMLAWLYDEDRWPSGTAGGKVTGPHPEFSRKMLLFTPNPYAPDRPNRATQPEPGRGQKTIRQDNGVLLAVYDIVLHEDGTLKSAECIGEEEEAKGTKWYAYMESSTADPWFNNCAYVDTLNSDAIKLFIETTHEAYRKAVGEEFDKTIPAIFTDEPQFAPKETLDYAKEEKDVFLSWTDKLPEIYRERYGEDLMEKIPELIWELPEGRLSQARYRFHDTVTQLFVDTYCKQIGAWCRENGIALTGHVMGESPLEKQTKAVGDAMRCYPEFGIPGIDMLCDWHEYNTAKQTQSMVHQMGKPGMLSELYGVTGWDYDFRGYKLQGDWQAALGVTVRVPHLSWMTMKGEAKRDYPASISYQSPWWDQFAMVEDHFARLNTAMTRGKANVKVGVIHPIESYWLYWGPAEQTAALRSRLEKQYGQLTEALLFGLIDFDFINEASLPAQCSQASNPLQVGEMCYDAVIISGCATLRATTLERLTAFAQQGGKVIFVGDCPEYVDAQPSQAVHHLYDNSIRTTLDQTAILKALETERVLDIRDINGRRTDKLIYQLREDGDAQWLFVANGKNPDCPDVDDAPVLRFTIRGEYRVTEYNTLNGEIRPLAVNVQGGNTVFQRPWHIHDSLLLRLEACKEEKTCTSETDKDRVAAEARHTALPVTMMGLVDVTLDEPNMLLLDMAEYSVNGGDWQPLEEVLRLDNQVRKMLQIPLRRKEVVQPYMIEEEIPENYLKLRFVIPAECRVEQPLLGLEDWKDTLIWWNGKRVEAKAVGWYVDKAIETVELPPLEIGENILELQVPIGRRTNLECYYLLGDFGVRVNGLLKTVTAPVRKLGFSDITAQGLPFYTGNINYHFEVETDGRLAIRVPRYRGGLVKVLVDGEDRGNIAFSPYYIEVDGLEAGRHLITLKLYGVRQNGFAQLHHTPGVYFYQSPNSWRSGGDLWCYEYQFKTMGILKSPELYGPKGGKAAEHFRDRS